MYSFEKNSRLYIKTTNTQYSHNNDNINNSKQIKLPLHNATCIQNNQRYILPNSQQHYVFVDTNNDQFNRQTQFQRLDSSEFENLSSKQDNLKTQMARDFCESQELYKSADQYSGLKTVKTKRILKKTTTITRADNKKVGDLIVQTTLVFR